MKLAKEEWKNFNFRAISNNYVDYDFNITVEEVYQMFKERLLQEVVAVDYWYDGYDFKQENQLELRSK